jgi:NADPH:quinone reductase-like Zn-dependent oxidoreductase
MRAIVCKRYGSPEVLELQEVMKPVPKRNEVLIRIMASTVGPADCAFRKGEPFAVKLVAGLQRPKHAILGTELAGLVEAVGEDVTLFQPGDQVYGLSPHTSGAHAEYKCLPENAVIIQMPTGMSYEETVAICDGAATSLTFLRDQAKVKRGQKVLINGASGAVGIYAVQLAKHYGAEVTGVCSSANVDLVKSQGADHVIDYTREDFTANGRMYDVIFDAVGKRNFSQCAGSLSRDGIYLSTTPTLSNLASMLRTMLFGRKKSRFVTAGLMQSKDNLRVLNGLCEEGVLRPVIDRRYSLEQVAEAHRYVDTGRKRGNVVIQVGQV